MSEIDRINNDLVVDDMVYRPNTIKSQDDLNPCNDGKRSSDVLIEAISKAERLQKQLDIAVKALDSLRGICFPERAEKALKEIEELNK